MHADLKFRTTTADLTNLIDWAVTGYDRTTNQHFRPALFIVVNNDTSTNTTQFCDVGFATQAILANLDNSTWLDEHRSLVDTWASRGKEIRSARELLFCYFDSLRVIFIPSGDAVPSRTIFRQYQKLYEGVQTSAHNVLTRRHSSGINPNVETLTMHTTYAFQALSESLDGTVDFHDIMRQVTRLPHNYAEHLVNTLVNLKEFYDGFERHLIKSIVHYLAATLAVADWGQGSSLRVVWIFIFADLPKVLTKTKQVICWICAGRHAKSSTTVSGNAKPNLIFQLIKFHFQFWGLD